MMVALRSFLVFSLFACYMCDNYTYEYYPRFHFGTPISCETKVGFMNDPNALIFFNNYYHLFFQHNPYSGNAAGTAHWGHAKSPDLVNWEYLPIALFPDQPYDKDGVFSGSGIVINNTMYLHYTGNVNHDDETPDHEQHQNLATSPDGIVFTKWDKNPIIKGTEHQPDFRDPKVWEHEGTFYMVLGSSITSNNDTYGQVLLYTSKDNINWEEAAVLGRSDGFLGYMWECPDFFEIDGYFVLMMSPQGMTSVGDDYKNLYQAGYLVGNFDYKTKKFTITSKFTELDNGHDFYATQTIVDEKGRRVMFAWMDMWEQNYPEGDDGFTGHLTLPRELKLTSDGRLLQLPLEDINQAVGRELYAGNGCSGTKVRLENNAGKVKIRTSSKKDFTLLIESGCANATVKIMYEHEEGRISLDRGGCDGVRRTKYTPKGDLELVMFIDSSSIEMFCGEGEVTMSSRFFPNGTVTVGLGECSTASVLVVNEMERTTPMPCHQV